MLKKKKWSLKKKTLVFGGSFFVLCLGTFLFLFYGPWAGFRNFWITSAMTTMNHQYLATLLYSDETIQEVLKQNAIIKPDGKTNTSLIKFLISF